MQTWGKTKEQLALREYPDNHWREAYSQLLELIESQYFTGMVLAPEKFSNPKITIYSNDQYAGVYAYILLHKGMLSYLSIETIFSLAQYEPFYENDVFVLLQKRISAEPAIEKMYGDLAGKIWSNSKRSAFIHVPKTAGTAVVDTLRDIMINVKYFDRRYDIGNFHEYTSIAGHFYLFDLIALKPGFDRIFSVLRDPMDRFLSAIAHTRRPSEDPSTLSASMLAMRYLSIMDFMRTNDASQEVNAFSFYLGWAPDVDERDLTAIRSRAFKQLNDNSVVLFDQNSTNALITYLGGSINGGSALVDEKNVTHDKELLFSGDEKEFIKNELSFHFEGERQFIASLTQFLYQAESNCE